VRLTAGGSTREGAAEDLLTAPPALHRLEALEDTVVLLTIVALPRLTATEPDA
jgi:quercetin dioxygenase-like cupin family protein